MNVYDVIVLGTGGVGSAAAYHLAKRNIRVLGLDRFPPGHRHGSSHGHTRIIRKAYFEHPNYVPLLNRAYQLWDELQQLHGAQLYFPVGLIEVGPRDGVVVPGVLASAQQHGLPVETLNSADLSQRYPGFTVPQELEAVFERDAGYLLVEDCVRAHAAEAQRMGAEFRSEETAVGFNCSPSGVAVTTTKATYEARSLVLTVGPWANQLLSDLAIPFRILRKHLHWYAAGEECYRADAGCPGFFYEVQGGFFYGFPAIDERGVKVAEHSGGTAVADPLQDDPAVEPEEQQRVETFLRSHLPGVTRQATRHEVCYYTLSPDEHFVLDQHPAHPNLYFAAGLSGHGFKFTSVLGEVLAELATEQRSRQTIDFLNCQRFGGSEGVRE